MLKRMFWNPERNEALFLVTCAERLLGGGLEFARRIVRRMPAPVVYRK